MPFTDQVLVAAGSVLTAVAASVVAWYSSRTRSGRLLRTIEQVKKVCELTERLAKLQDSLATRPIDDEAKRLLQSCLAALSEDFERERRLLPEFQVSASSFRKSMLLTIPSRWMAWPFQLAFHSALLFVVLVFLRAAAFLEWRYQDTVAIAVALGVALLLRGLVALIVQDRVRAA